MWYDIFLSFGEAIAEKGLRGVAELVPGGGVVFDIFKGAYEKLKLRRQLASIADDNERHMAVLRQDVEAMVQAAPAEIEKVAVEIVEKVVPKELEHLRPIVQVYLEQIPSVAQQSLKRPEDPTGRSVPRDFRLASAEDLAKLAPATWPRFKRGDRVPGRDDWVLDRHLGGGGFGEVWLVQTEFFAYAVKFCKGLDSRDRDLRHEGSVIKRLMRESKRKDIEEVIVPLRDVYLDGNDPWLAYDYVEGGTLADAMQRWASLPRADHQQMAAKALRMLANAVGFFHRLDPPIVHRDLKPANILYDKHGKRLRITDFGIGGIAAGDLINREKQGSLTAAARLQSYLYGSYSPLYASPQQKAGAPPDPRDDVHAFGVIGYQMLTGNLQHGPGSDLVDDLRELQVDEALIDLLRRCTAQKLERRPKDAGELAAALAALAAPQKTREAATAVPPARPGTIDPPPVVPLAPATVRPAPTPSKPPKQPQPKPGDIITNSLGMKLALIPAGKFFMGSPNSEHGHSNEESPQHKVEITRPFLLGVYQVTQEEYQKVMSSNPSWFSTSGQGKDKVKGQDTRRFPVEWVSWVEAVAYCRKLSELLEEKRAGRVYRLPTEAEWEYACRAGTTTPFYFGNSLSSQQAKFDGNYPFSAVEIQRTTTVGSYPANELGLFDMHGNV